MSKVDSQQMQTPLKLCQSQEPDDVSAQFNLNQPKFVSLGSGQDFSDLKASLLEIDVGTALEQLEGESYFEVTLPMTGMVDFLSQSPTWQDLPQSFPTIIAINGFGAMDEGGFAKPYFVLAKDILGNEFEILIDSQGQVEVPEQGMGLFSMLQSLTLIYSQDQVMQGEGLASLTEHGAQDGMLYLLPPPGLEASFNAKVGVSHLDDYLQRTVDFEMTVPVEVFAPDRESHIEANLELLSDNQIAVHLQGSKAQAKDACACGLKLEGDFTIQAQSTPWLKSPDGDFSLALGLSVFSKTAVVRSLFSEFDFAKSILQGKSWGIENTHGFNDLSISPEALGPIYDLYVDAIVQNKIPIDTLFEQIAWEDMPTIDLSHLVFEGTEKMAIDFMVDAMKNKDLKPLQDLFSGPDGQFEYNLILESATPLTQEPQLQVEFLASNNALSQILDLEADPLYVSDHSLDALAPVAGVGETLDMLVDIEPGSALYASTFQNGVSLQSDHEPVTIVYQDVVDFSDLGDTIEGFNMESDQIDLNGLLEQMPGASIDNVMIEAKGEDIHVSIEGQAGEAMPVVTLVGAAGGDGVQDLASIITPSDFG